MKLCLRKCECFDTIIQQNYDDVSEHFFSQKNMLRHTNKIDFQFIALTVMILEVASLIVFTSGVAVAIFGTWWFADQALNFVLFGFVMVVVSFFTLVSAEFLQLLMKIEYNTRKPESMVSKMMHLKMPHMPKMTKKKRR